MIIARCRREKTMAEEAVECMNDAIKCAYCEKEGEYERKNVRMCHDHYYLGDVDISYPLFQTGKTTSALSKKINEITASREKLMAEKAVECMNDVVNHPSHYNQGGIECIDALAAATINLNGIEAIDTANAIKYLWRWKQKNGVQDLKKAVYCINHLIDLIEKPPTE